MILLATIGAIVVLKESGHVYVGNKTTKLVYDYKLCPEQIENIQEENQKVFNNLREAQAREYKNAEGCI